MYFFHIIVGKDMKVMKKLHCDNIWVKILTQASTQVSRLTVQKTNYVKKGTSMHVRSKFKGMLRSIVTCGHI